MADPDRTGYGCCRAPLEGYGVHASAYGDGRPHASGGALQRPLEFVELETFTVPDYVPGPCTATPDPTK